MPKQVMDSVILDFGPPTTQAVQHAQAFWDRLYAEQRAAKSPAEKQAASEKIWNAATKRTGPGEPWPFPDSAYDGPAKDAPQPCAPGSWDTPADKPTPVREQRQGTPEEWDNAPQEAPSKPEPRSEWVSAPVAKLKW